MNHTLHATDNPTKRKILKTTNEIINYYFSRGMTDIPPRYLFLFYTYIHTLLSHPCHKRLPWIAAISSARRRAQRRVISNRYLDTYEIILESIIKGRLIPSLMKFGKAPTLSTNMGLTLH